MATINELKTEKCSGLSDLTAGLGAWRSIDSAPKGTGEHVLAYFPSMGIIFQCWQRKDGVWMTGFAEPLDNPTHWQPANAPNVKLSAAALDTD